MGEWQPISAAPKDGTPILAWVKHANWDVGEDTSSPRSSSVPFCAVVFYDTDDRDWFFEQDFHAAATAVPTHWMPRPDPPAS